MRARQRTALMVSIQVSEADRVGPASLWTEVYRPSLTSARTECSKYLDDPNIFSHETRPVLISLIGLSAGVRSVLRTNGGKFWFHLPSLPTISAPFTCSRCDPSICLWNRAPMFPQACDHPAPATGIFCTLRTRGNKAKLLEQNFGCGRSQPSWRGRTLLWGRLPLRSIMKYGKEQESWQRAGEGCAWKSGHTRSVTAGRGQAGPASEAGHRSCSLGTHWRHNHIKENGSWQSNPTSMTQRLTKRGLTVDISQEPGLKTGHQSPRSPRL